MESLGHDIDGGGNCQLTAADDLPSRTALLGPLTDNGGPTDPHAPLPGSPALDAAAHCPATEQRGVPRPQGAAGDSCAYDSAQ
ncbi:choice-of-anchor Q domain-containing protein [Streptomyces sp. NPDC051636]|uniref:choice-of-anchor Q domain-containing protein n=1 Tax=Streptomyces sp. NPDC051636 TaxID=3365663 RepID=UPI0037AABFAE